MEYAVIVEKCYYKELSIFLNKATASLQVMGKSLTMNDKQHCYEKSQMRFIREFLFVDLGKKQNSITSRFFVFTFQFHQVNSRHV